MSEVARLRYHMAAGTESRFAKVKKPSRVQARGSAGIVMLPEPIAISTE